MKWILGIILVLGLLVLLGPMIFPALGIVFVFILVSALFDKKKDKHV